MLLIFLCIITLMLFGFSVTEPSNYISGANQLNKDYVVKMIEYFKTHYIAKDNAYRYEEFEKSAVFAYRSAVSTFSRDLSKVVMASYKKQHINTLNDALAKTIARIGSPPRNPFDVYEKYMIDCNDRSWMALTTILYRDLTQQMTDKLVQIRYKEESSTIIICVKIVKSGQVIQHPDYWKIIESALAEAKKSN